MGSRTIRIDAYPSWRGPGPKSAARVVHTPPFTKLIENAEAHEKIHFCPETPASRRRSQDAPLEHESCIPVLDPARIMP
jgi:hypothetical protein